MADDRKCPSLMGLIFGHKYVKRFLDRVFQSDHCYRCGRPR